MKRLLVLFFLFMLLFVLNVNSELTLFDVFADDAQSFYIISGLGVGDNSLNFNGNNYVSMINKFDVKTKNFDAKNISGQSVFMGDKNKDFVIRKLNLNLVQESNCGSVKEVLGYTHKFKNYVLINGQKVNVQISESDVGIMVGYPLILQGF
jgi:hypothetical protein